MLGKMLFPFLFSSVFKFFEMNVGKLCRLLNSHFFSFWLAVVCLPFIFVLLFHNVKTFMWVL